MNRSVKLILDIVMGSVIPIWILNNLNEQLGTVITYIVAALVSIFWVLLDLFFITKRFNLITSYVGAFAIGRGLLAFWFVDGVQFAFKDSVGTIFIALVFGGSIIVRRPVMYYLIVQAFNPNTPKQEQSLKALLKESKVYRSLVKGTKTMLVVTLLTGIVNFFLNLQIVEADFGTASFNQQVAQVDAITRIVLTIPEFVVFWIVIVSIRRTMFYFLPKEGIDQSESDLWDLLELREIQRSRSQSQLVNRN
ncbi:hypothetical protein S7335_296 [Synechococcus sp. PCC 7335]|uniref:VC0807 family protein n=1 Tax=Synechococcus sp. (strain ATCC 29403 / PCC 7335) TaxID=91464 RepID=UPI00017EE821|nr:VC0807 family protein [Synechococcus sp. PCC 7335]EDX83118.1 hypothetical protein S7335_296 [Synechococcus sp. PCC 7335]